MVDVHGLFRARWFGRPGAPTIPLYAPQGVFTRIAGLEDDDPEIIRQVFYFYPLPRVPAAIGPFQLDSIMLPHDVPNAGLRLSAPGLTVAYTGDTGRDPR